VIDRGHAGVELALAVGVLLFPVALVITAFGPWSERRVEAEAIAAEASRAAVLQLDQDAGQAQVVADAAGLGIDPSLVRVGWCGADPAPMISPQWRLSVHAWIRCRRHDRALDTIDHHSMGRGGRLVGVRRSHRAHRPLQESGVRSSDEGSVTIWVLGLSMLLLVFGGLAIDYWRALVLQRELASVADSAAIAAASGIDEETYRATGDLVLEPDRARTLADAAVSWQGIDVLSTDVVVAPNAVSVTLTAAVELGLLGVFVDQDEPLTVRGTATAVPVLLP